MARIVMATVEPPLVSPGPRRWLGHSDFIAAIWLTGSLAVLVAAALMKVGPERLVYVNGWSQPVPEVCWLYKNWRIDCPGCGLTRSFIHLMHGQLSQAWHTSPVGILVFGFACAQIPCGIAQVFFRKRNRWTEQWGRMNDWCVAGLLIALMLQWGIRLWPWPVV